MMSSALSRKRHGFFALLLLLLPFATFFLSCKESPSDPSYKLVPPSDPGTVLVETGNVGSFAWFPDGAEIAYSIGPADQPTLVSYAYGIHAVDVNTRAARSLYEEFTIFEIKAATADSVFVTMSVPSATYAIARRGSGTPVWRTYDEQVVSGQTGGVVAFDYRQTDSLRFHNLQTGEKTIFSRENDFPLAVSPDGREVFTWNSIEYRARILNLASHASTSLQIPGKPSGWYFAPMVVWVGGQLRLLEVYPDTSDVYYLTDPLTGQRSELWRSAGINLAIIAFFSRDGAKIAYVRATPANVEPVVHQLFVGDVVTHKQTFITSAFFRRYRAPSPFTHVAFSQNGKRIAYIIEGNLYYKDL